MRWRKRRRGSNLVLAVHRHTPARAPVPDESDKGVPKGEEGGFGPGLLQVALFLAAAAATGATVFCFWVGEDRFSDRFWWLSARWF